MFTFSILSSTSLNIFQKICLLMVGFNPENMVGIYVDSSDSSVQDVFSLESLKFKAWWEFLRIVFLTNFIRKQETVAEGNV